MMKKSYEKIIIGLFLIIYIYIFPISYSVFDKLFVSNKEKIYIGNWISLEDRVNPPTLLSYLENYNTIIKTKTDNVTVDIRDYLYSILFEEDELGNIEFTKIDNIYYEYTNQEIIDAIELIKDFSINYLIYDKLTNNMIYPNYSLVTPVQINLDNGLLPGEYIHLYQIIMTANLATTNKFDSILIIVSLEGDQEDLSDFTIDFLVDSTPYNLSNPFSYAYLLDGDKISNSVDFGFVLSDKNSLIPIDDANYYRTKTFKLINDTFQETFYNHIYPKPNRTGKWCRYPVGPNYYLAIPKTNSDFQEFVLDKPKTRQGLLLMGKNYNQTSDIRFTSSKRNSIDQKPINSIPMIFTLTRGLEIDKYGYPIINQNQQRIKPIIKILIIENYII